MTVPQPGTAAPAARRTPTSRMLQRLALVQHLLFGVLVAVCLVRAWTTGASKPLLIGTTVLLVAWYLAGAVRATTQLGRASSTLPPSPTSAAAAGSRLLTPGGWWLIGLVGCWLLGVAVSAENVWVGFSLWLLAGHLLPLRVALPVSGLILLVVIARPWHADGGSVAGVVGPTIGAVFALALSRGLQVVVRDSLERQRLVADLVAAQAETEELHAELAATQREAGVLAERTRLSRDIHDTLAQGFSSILLLARAGSATDDPAATARLLAQIETSAADNLDEARRVVGALAPAPLQSGLVEALRRILDRFGDETGVDTDLRVEGDLTALTPRLEVALLRVAQSSLANVRQHAHARRVVVTIAEAEDLVRLDLVDDGRGFDPAVLGRPATEVQRGGYGLRASRQRLRELGGGLDVESEPGGGTAVSAFLPRSSPIPEPVGKPSSEPDAQHPEASS